MNERRAFVVKFCLVRQPEYTSVTRALGELEARWPVQINVPGETLLILPVEGLDSQRLTEFASSGGREEERFVDGGQRCEFRRRGGDPTRQAVPRTACGTRR